MVYHFGMARRPELSTKRWKRTRRAVIELAGWRCQKCGKAGRLEVDHIEPVYVNPLRNRFDRSNLQALCENCHWAKSSGEKRNPMPDDQRAWMNLMRSLNPIV